MPIQLLPDHIIHQIAAAEVVQRPASVLKELLENAIDAKSKQITVIFADGGKQLIHVIDDGEGMDQRDARLCWERHATSKLLWQTYPPDKSSESLYNILTLGFRGEALPSIAAVSQVEMVTRTASCQVGTQLWLEGGKIERQQLVAATPGTQVKVKNLFFNTPARRQFLRSSAIEAKHLIEEFQRAALAYPEIGFVLKQEEKVLYDLPASKLAVRIVRLFGEHYQKRLVPCEEKNQFVQVEGYIGTPAAARKSSWEQFFFVNKRFVKSSYLQGAVRKAFEGLIPDQAHPFFVLHLTVAPQDLDVHVHPAKTAVKFGDEKLVYTVLQAAVRKALATHHMMPSIDFSQHVNRFPYDLGQRTTLASRQERDYAHFQGLYQERKGYASPTLSASNENPASSAEKLPLAPPLPAEAWYGESKPLTPLEEAPSLTEEGEGRALLIHNEYLVASAKEGILLVHLRRAQERVLYERYKRRLDHNTKAVQKNLFPAKVALSHADFLLVQQAQAEIEALGFHLELEAPDSVKITAQPPEAISLSPHSFLEEWLAYYREMDDRLHEQPHTPWLRTLVKRLATAHLPQTAAEQQALIQQLFSCANPNYTPDGERVWQLLSLDQLARLLS